MKRNPIESDAILTVGYDAQTEVLDIEFTSQLIYRYRSVPASIYAALLKAESKGRFFNAHIRDRYSYVMVRA